MPPKLVFWGINPLNGEQSHRAPQKALPCAETRQIVKIGPPVRARRDPKYKVKRKKTKMLANAQRDGRPAEYRWRPLFNAAKFG